jgi:hypothetical protein
MNIDMLKKRAEEQVSQYPQYKGHFDNYVLVRVKKDIKTKFGLAFSKDEIALCKPDVRVHENIRGNTQRMATAWSMNNRIDTSINDKDVDFC